MVFSSNSWSLCGFLYCEIDTGGRKNLIKPFGRKEEICRESCLNFELHQRNNLECRNDDGESKPGAENKPGQDIGRTESGDINLCDMVCDMRDCSDESLCNGHMYGRICLSTEFAGLIINPPFELCNGEPFCLYKTIDERFVDEEGCDLDVSGRARCISGDISRRKNVEKIIPIFNYTRCSAIVWSEQLYGRYFGTGNLASIAKLGTPYCKDYIDQTNCTDKTRVAVSCYIQGYGNSTISKTMVCGRFHRRFCLDGMDAACVDVDRTCTIHKHRLCDGQKDCESGSDEKHPWCLAMTEKTCHRNYRSNRSLSIPDVWLGDGMNDCLDGLDEHWDIECGLSSATRRYEVIAGDSCEDVFLCRHGETKFLRLPQLCAGMGKCSDDRICELGRGLSSMSTYISRLTTVMNSRFISFCLQGLEDLVKKISPCFSKEFNPFDEDVFGMGSRTKVVIPMKLADCDSIFGEAYVLTSCLGMCKNSQCPLKQPISYNDCPLQYGHRIYTVVDRNRLTFVQRKGNDFNNDFFMCENGFKCTAYDKVCNLWDDCGDGSDEKNCSNNFICEDNQGILPLSKKCDGFLDCRDISDECNSECNREIINSSVLKAAAWFIGLLAVLSNIIVLQENACNLKNCNSGQSLTNKLLIIFIGIGDFLIGIYLLFIAVVDSFIYGEGYCSKRLIWLTSWYCSSLGVISTLGSFLSLFALTILSIIRVFSIASGDLQRPEKDITRVDYVKIVLLLTAIVAAATTIAGVPLLDVSDLEDFFVNGLVYEKSLKIFHGQVGKAKHLKVIQSYYGRSRNQTLSWRQIQSLVGSMFSNDYGNLDGKVFRVNFYGNDGVCLFKFFVTEDDPQWIFSMAVLAISIVCFVVVTVAYITINIITYKSSRSLLLTKGPTANVVKKRNQRLQRKIATIIITDFLCWVPFVLTCFLHFFGALDATAQYGMFSIIILPINSIINPFLYSEMLHDCANKFWTRIRKFLTKFCNLEQNTPECPEEKGSGVKRTGESPNKKEEIPMIVINQEKDARNIEQKDKEPRIVVEETKDSVQSIKAEKRLERKPKQRSRGFKRKGVRERKADGEQSQKDAGHPSTQR